METPKRRQRVRMRGFKVALLPILIVVSLAAPLLAALTVSVEAREMGVAPDGYAYSTCSLRLLVDNNEYILAHGGPNAYNMDTYGAPPENWYGITNRDKEGYIGELPPIVAAAEVGLGRVIACGNGGGLAYDRPWKSDVGETHLKWYDWLDTENSKTILWYEGRDMYYAVSKPPGDDGSCHYWKETLENKGYTVDHTSVPWVITPGMIENYAILVISNQKVEEYLPSEISAIENWVEAGGGLFLGYQSDYFMGYGGLQYINSILEELDVPFRFQDDQVVDPVECLGDWEIQPRLWLTDHPANPVAKADEAGFPLIVLIAAVAAAIGGGIAIAAVLILRRPPKVAPKRVRKKPKRAKKKSK